MGLTDSHVGLPAKMLFKENGGIMGHLSFLQQHTSCYKQYINNIECTNFKPKLKRCTITIEY